MRLFILLWIAEAVFSALFIVAGHPISTKKGFGFKMVACALYIANGLYAYALSGKTAFGVIVLLGLFGGLLGDIFLASDPFFRDKHSSMISLVFGLGGLFFLAGHVAYMVAFGQLLHTAQTFRFLPFAALWGGLLLLFALLMKITGIRAGKYTLPVALYACVLSCMFSLGICAALFAAQSIMLRRILIAAPVLFVCSDITLAMKTADNDRFGSLCSRAFCLTCYFLAQMLFGLAIMLH